MRKIRALLLTAAVAAHFMHTGAAYPAYAEGRDGRVLTFTFSVIPFYGPEKIWKLYTPFVDYLNKTTGLPWELKLFHNHEDVIAGLCSGDISIAMLGPVPLGIASRRCGVEPLVVVLGADGRPFYRSVMLASKNGIEDLKRLKGKRVAFFRSSTASHVLPLKMLKDAGVAKGDITPAYYPNQESILKAVLSGEVAAGGVKESLFRKFQKAPLRVLKASDEVPQFAFCAAPTLGAKARQRFINVLLRLKPLNRADHRNIVMNWDDEIRYGFARPGDHFLEDALRLSSTYEEIGHEDR